VEREEAHERPYEEVRDALRNKERSRRYQDRLADYMSELEGKAFIAGTVPPEAQGFRRQRAQVRAPIRSRCCATIPPRRRSR
jgi:hypothetical protein